MAGKSQEAKITLSAEEGDLPEGITFDVSSAAQTIAKTPRKWFEENL
jgi:hypothetical protein